MQVKTIANVLPLTSYAKLIFCLLVQSFLSAVPVGEDSTKIGSLHNIFTLIGMTDVYIYK